MKIIVIGGTGTIGKAVVKELGKHHQVIVAGMTHGDICVDISDETSIEKMYQSIESLDAVVATTGKVHFADFSVITSEDYLFGLKNKLMGQVNLVLIGQKYLNDGGSFTLTSGILNQDPIRTGTSAAMVNGAIEGFVKNVAIELPRNMRINAISPTVITESMPLYGDYFRGYESISASKVALAYSKSVNGAQTGQVYRVGYS